MPRTAQFQLGVTISDKYITIGVVLSPEMGYTGRNYLGDRSLGVSNGSIARALLRRWSSPQHCSRATEESL